MLQETERMLIKHRINEETRENKEKDKKEGVYTERKAEIHPDSPKEERKQLLDSLWNENKERFIYNPLEKVVNFNKARATDYPTSTFVSPNLFQ